MTDQPEKNSETEDAEVDFEGHRKHAQNAEPERAGEVSTQPESDEDADFEGHRHHGPERHGRHA